MGLTILIVEEEPLVRQTGREGVTAFREAAPALVILDIGLPDMSGLDVCREIRASSQTPILFLTAREGEIDRVLGLELGADDYVVKPFSPRELSARVRAILRRTQAAREEPLPDTEAPGCAAFEVDDVRQRICYRGQALTVHRYELGLLKLLAAHPGRVYTRDQLMDQVWEEPEASTDRTVDAHVKALRSKLREIDGTVDPIVTHRGIGYSLREDLDSTSS